MIDRAEIRAILDSSVGREVWSMLCAEPIGRGLDRIVFAHAADPTLVVKIESGINDRFQNVAEWNTWRELQDSPEHAAWLAPCVAISYSGAVLIQRRTKPIPTRRLPPKVPAWLTDRKPEQMGLYKGRPVFHDYGLTTPTYPMRHTPTSWTVHDS